MYDLGRYVTNQHANRKFQTVGNFSNNVFQVLKTKQITVHKMVDKDLCFKTGSQATIPDQWQPQHKGG